MITYNINRSFKINLTFSASPIRNNMVRFEGIKSFYDYRQVTAEQLKKDAQQLIDVSDRDNLMNNYNTFLYL